MPTCEDMSDLGCPTGVRQASCDLDLEAGQGGGLPGNGKMSFGPDVVPPDSTRCHPVFPQAWVEAQHPPVHRVGSWPTLCSRTRRELS